MPAIISNVVAEYKDETNFMDMDEDMEQLIEDTLVEMELSPEDVEAGILGFFAEDDEDASLTEEVRKDIAINKIAGHLLDGYNGIETRDFDEAFNSISDEAVDKVLLGLMCSSEFGDTLVNLDIQDEDFDIPNAALDEGIEESPLEESRRKEIAIAKIKADAGKHRPVTRSMTRKMLRK